MKTLLDSFSSASVSAFGWTLVHSLWQGTLLAILAAVLFQLLRKKTAVLRYNIGILLLVGQAIASLSTFIWYRWITSGQKIHDGSDTNLQPLTDNLSLTRIEYQLSFISKIQLWFYMHLNELVICWLIGAAALMVRFLGGWIYTEILRSESRAISNNEWRTRFGLLAARLNISTEIELRETTRILTPMVIGVVRPMVLIPMGLLTGFSSSQVEAILAHELAHVRRSDFVVNLMQSLIEVIYFFHPGLWWLSEKIRNERENCCDDIAVGICGDRVSLANALVKVAEWQNAPTLAMAFASRKPMLMHRVRRVLGLTPKPVKTFAPMPFMVITLSLLIGASLYAVGQQDEKKPIVQPAKKATGENIKVTIENNVVNQADQTPQISLQAPVITYNVPSEITVDTLKGNVTSTARTTITLSSGPEGNVAVISPAEQISDEETEKIRLQIEELRLQHEKLSFDAERAQRQSEKLEWKKQSATEARYKLMEKRSTLLNPPKPATVASGEVEKQLADFEEQIRAQEEIITKLNIELIESRKEAYKAEEPLRKIEKEIDDLSRKIDHSAAAMYIEPEIMAVINGRHAPRPATVPRVAATPRPATRAKSARPAKKIAPPPPPVEAVKIAPPPAPVKK